MCNAHNHPAGCTCGWGGDGKRDDHGSNTKKDNDKTKKLINKGMKKWIDDLWNTLALEAQQRKEWVERLLLSLEAGYAFDQLLPNSLDDVRPGDVILPLPATVSTKSWYTYVKSSASKVASESVRELDRIISRRKTCAPASHALLVLTKDPRTGEQLYLDHTPEGSRILTETEFIERYEYRKFHVARPLSSVDADRLIKEAKKKDKTTKEIGSDYGLLGSNIVCSQNVGLILAKCTKLPLLKSMKFRLGGTLFPGARLSVSDFYDKQDADGRHFVISCITKTRGKTGKPRKSKKSRK